VTPPVLLEISTGKNARDTNIRGEVGGHQIGRWGLACRNPHSQHSLILIIAEMSE